MRPTPTTPIGPCGSRSSPRKAAPEQRRDPLRDLDQLVHRPRRRCRRGSRHLGDRLPDVGLRGADADVADDAGRVAVGRQVRPGVLDRGDGEVAAAAPSRSTVKTTGSRRCAGSPPAPGPSRRWAPARSAGRRARRWCRRAAGRPAWPRALGGQRAVRRPLLADLARVRAGRDDRGLARVGAARRSPRRRAARSRARGRASSWSRGRRSPARTTVKNSDRQDQVVERARRTSR